MPIARSVTGGPTEVSQRSTVEQPSQRRDERRDEAVDQRVVLLRLQCVGVATAEPSEGAGELGAQVGRGEVDHLQDLVDQRAEPRAGGELGRGRGGLCVGFARRLARHLDGLHGLRGLVGGAGVADCWVEGIGSSAVGRVLPS